jgi:exonuclease VII small subunit
VALILAESGIGKSRLVQALYQQLTVDGAWDPPEVDYWPDAFNDQGMQLRVTPDMTGHVAKGPPRFAWLGARWQPSDVRNVSDRRTVLPELRHSMATHAEILKRHGSSWQDATGRIREAISREGLGETLGQVADAAVPFGGLLMKIAKNAANFAKDRLSDPRSFEQAEDVSNKTLVDEVCECLHSLVDGAGGLPTVLWLDDAQWIDAETLEFVRRIWLTAQRRQWPLLLVVTHWEREWRELKRSPEAGQHPLSLLEGQPGVELRVLRPVPPDALNDYLESKLPGLTPPQRALMLQKAAGNFLTLVENVGQLLRTPPNFVNRDVSLALSPAGERKVQEWESDRQKRVEQRFSELAPELQEMLGWGSHLGMSFLREVVEEFAERVAGKQGAGAMLAEAVDPLVILGQPSEHLREFRDKAFHHVASRHFRDYGQEHAEALGEILRTRLVEWVNNSFDPEGDEIWPDLEEGIAAPPRSVTSLPTEEARDLLGMAAGLLALPDSPDWTDPAHQAALRARFLLVVVDWRENLWDRVRGHCNDLHATDWEQMPASVLSIVNLEWLADQSETAGAMHAAFAVQQRLLGLAREAAKDCRPESFRDLSVSLNNIAGLEEANGDLAAALSKYEESLAIARRLAQELGTPESHRDVIVGLDNIARIDEANGDLAAALPKYEESLAIARRLAQELGTPESHRDVSIGLNNIAGIERANGDLDAALPKYEESLAIARRLAEELGTPESHRDVSVSLNDIAGIERANGDLAAALAKYEESLAIARRLAQELGTPQSHRDVSRSLNNVIWITAVAIEACLSTQLKVASDRVAASRAWVDEFELAIDSIAKNVNSADTLAAWWEQVAAVAQAQGNAADVAAALAKAHHWRDRQRELRASQADSGEQPA